MSEKFILEKLLLDLPTCLLDLTTKSLHSVFMKTSV